MANKNPNPSTRFPAKYLDHRGKAVPTARIRIPEYLLEEIEEFAQKQHQIYVEQLKKTEEQP